MPVVYARDARRLGESEINHINRVAQSEADRELGPAPGKLNDKQMREIGDRARKTFKEDMGLTYTKENNKILQELHQRFEKEELQRLQTEYLQKRKALIEQKMAEKANLLGLYDKPKSKQEEKDLIKFPSREEELKGLFGGIKRRKTRVSKKSKKRKTQRRRN